MDTTEAEKYEKVAAGADFGIAWARKSGRTSRWPYVPVIVMSDGVRKQVLGLAYATRMEAVAAAERHLANLRSNLAKQLAEPRMRALREYYGLPRELVQADRNE